MKLFLSFFFILALSIGYSKNSLWTCINENGETIFQLEAKYISEFSDGMAAVEKSWVENNAWVTKLGFVNQKGELEIPCEYDKTKGRGFVNGRAWVYKKAENQWLLIDKTGKIIPTANYDNVGYIFKNNLGVMAVYKNDRLGFIDQSGKEIIACQYLGGTFFAEGLACVTPYEGEKGYGFISPEGEVVIPFQFKQAGIANFEPNGMCRATVAGKTVLIDKKGNVVFKTSKGNIQGVSNNWIRVFSKPNRLGWGFLNFNDEWMIDPLYDDLSDFGATGMALAQKDELWGIIDTNNAVILPFKYATLYFDPQEDGYIMGAYPTEENMNLLDTPKDYFTPNFDPVDMSNMAYIYPAEGANLMAFLDKSEKRGYLNRDFTIAIPAKYSKARTFSEGLAWVLD